MDARSFAESLKDELTPIIPIDSDNVEILDSPEDFYQALIKGIKSAKNRISIATLYFGTGILEQELIKELREAGERRSCHIEVLIEGSRGTRSTKITQNFQGSNQSENENHENFESSVNSLTRGLFPAQETNKRIDIFAFLSPLLFGIRLQLIPERINEVLNVQHIKAYIFDDTVILSGANLSHDYFSKRKDRAWVIKNTPQLAGFYCRLIKKISEFCHKVDSRGFIQENRSLTKDIRVYKHRFNDCIRRFLLEEASKNYDLDKDTYMLPVIQMGLFTLSTEWKLIDSIFVKLKQLEEKYSVTLCSGYFSPSKDLENHLINAGIATRCKNFQVIVASPKANSFLKSKGLSGYLPSLYRESLINFLAKINFQTDKCQILEYSKTGWTFHAKGLWIQLPKVTFVSIGSSNFNNRSKYRDLESQTYFVTSNPRFRTRINSEVENITNNKFVKNVNLKTLMEQKEYRALLPLRLLFPLIKSFL